MARRKKKTQELCQVKAIVGVKTLKNGNRQFKVKWADVSGHNWSEDKWDRWVDEEGLLCSDLVAEFLQKQKDSAGPSSSSSSRRRDPSPSFVVPSTPRLKAPKPEPISPEKSARREPQSAVTNEKELNKFKGRGKATIAPGRQKAYAISDKLEKDKKKKNRRVAPPVQPPVEHSDGDAESLFRNSPTKLQPVKLELHGDSDGMEDGIGRMAMDEEFDMDGRDEREESTMDEQMMAEEQGEATEGHRAEERNEEDREEERNKEDMEEESTGTESSTEDGDGRLQTPGTESLPSVDPVNEQEDERHSPVPCPSTSELTNDEKEAEEKEEEEEEKGEDEYASSNEDVADDDDNGLIIDEGDTEEVAEEDVAMENAEEDENEEIAEEMDVLNFNPHPTGRSGYDDNLKGTIVDNASFLFDNGEEVDFFRVVFIELDRSQWIRREIVKEKDRTEYNRYMIKLAHEQRRAEIAQGAANYRAARARIEKEQREQAERIVRGD